MIKHDDILWSKEELLDMLDKALQERDENHNKYVALLNSTRPFVETASGIPDNWNDGQQLLFEELHAPSGHIVRMLSAHINAFPAVPTIAQWRALEKECAKSSVH